MRSILVLLKLLTLLTFSFLAACAPSENVALEIQDLSGSPRAIAIPTSAKTVTLVTASAALAVQVLVIDATERPLAVSDTSPGAQMAPLSLPCDASQVVVCYTTQETYPATLVFGL